MYALSEDASHDAARQDWDSNGTHHIMVDDENRKLVERSHSYRNVQYQTLGEPSLVQYERP